MKLPSLFASKTICFLTAFSAAGGIFSLPSLQAADNLWTNAGSGYWDIGENWSEGLPVATSGNPVFINNGGTAVIRQAGTTISPNVMNVGSNGTGTLQITAGATFESRNALIGSTSTTTGTGTVSLSGAGASWTIDGVSSYLNLARYGGSATMTVSDGAALTTSRGAYLSQSGGVSSLTIDNATWNASGSGNVWIGGAGQGTVTLQNGATATAFSINVNSQYGLDPTSGSGSLVVNNSALTTESSLNVSSGTSTTPGLAKLEVRNGGTVSVGQTMGISGTLRANTEVLVTGEDSRLTVASAFNAQKGTLTISDGGKVGSGAKASIGAFSGDDFIATVTGEGSELKGATGVDVGVIGTGVLIVADGGKVISGSDGTADLRVGTYAGSASTWVPNPPKGNGTLQIGNGGRAGLIEAGIIYGGGSGSDSGGAATLIFNHNESAYTLANKLAYGGNASKPGTFRVEHNGPGTTILTANNSYNSGTFVNDGTLLVNGGAEYLTDEWGSFLIASATGTGEVTVAASGRFGGSGDIGGATTVAGTLLAGTRTGSLNFLDDLTLEENSVLRLELGGTGFESIHVAGELSLSGRVEVVLLNGFAPEDYTFDVFDHDTLSYSLRLTLNDGVYDIQQFGDFTLSASVSAIPEPSTLGLLVLALGGIAAWRRRS